MEEIPDMTADCNESIDDFAKRMVEEAIKHGHSVTGIFNGVLLFASINMSADFLAGFYKGYMQAKSSHNRGGLRAGF